MDRQSEPSGAAGPVPAPAAQQAVVYQEEQYDDSYYDEQYGGDQEGWDSSLAGQDSVAGKMDNIH